MIDLKAKPFFLNGKDIRWVEETLAAMTLEEKAGQVFCPMGFSDDPGLLRHMLCEVHVGGMMYRPGPAATIQNTHRTIQSMAKIPLLLAANTENGGNGLAFEGTSFGQPMAVAATGDPENAYRMGYTACAEGAALGLNWSFAPIVDINCEFHNPITNVRTFGSNAERVIACGSAYLRGAKENGVAVSVKHFPGDGVDERDQHILTSVNSLSREAWDESFGKVYAALIEQGAETVMVGHIALPAYADDKEKYLPASLSKSIMTGLLREKLGFNGLISTDATPMVGFTAAMPRAKAIPTAIAAGADMILFNKDLDEDYRFLLAGIESGLLSIERLDEAVTRILATKAALRLQALANYQTYRNNDLVKRCLYLFAGSTLPGGRVGAGLFIEPEVEADDTVMFDYSLFYAPTLLDYYEQTHDRETLAELWPTAWRQMELAQESFDEHGLVRDSDALGWCFVDWNLGLNKQASAQGIYLYCLKAAGKIAEILGDEEKTARIKADYEKKKQAALDSLYDPARGLFVSGAEKQLSWASQIWMVLGGACGGEVLRRAEQAEAVTMVTPYLYHHYVQALIDVGEKDKALQVLTDYWGGMVKEGADTFWELYDPADPNASPYGGTIVNSYCHAWSCAPAYFLRKYYC